MDRINPGACGSMPGSQCFYGERQTELKMEMWENTNLMPEVQFATAKILGEKIRTRRARVGLVGLGYVGLPLAVEFAKAGFSVTGIDLHAGKTERVNAGDSYV